MTDAEKPKSKIGKMESFKDSSEYNEIIERLLELDVLDVEKRNAVLTADLDEHLRTLDVLGIRIQELSEIWADDPYFKQIQAAYEDLLADRDLDVNWDIDTSTYEMGELLNKEIKPSGIKLVEADKLSGKLKREAETLEALDIPVEYAVLAKNPRKAPTVVLFLQIHIDQNGMMYPESRQSQEFVDAHVTALLDSGQATDLYVEGVSEHIPLEEFLSSPRADNIGGLRLAESKENLRIRGAESPGVIDIANVELMKFKRSRDYKGLRLILGSILFGHNIVEMTNESDESMVMATVGIGHDVNIGKRIPEESFVRMSEIIAFEGANVLVVNTVPATYQMDVLDPRFKPKKIEQVPEISQGLAELLAGANEIGRITPRIKALEKALFKQEYDEWASMPGRLGLLQLTYGADATIPTYEEWFTALGKSKITGLFAPHLGNIPFSLEHLYEEVKTLPEKKLPENFLRAKYSLYVWKSKREQTDTLDYYHWLKQELK